MKKVSEAKILRPGTQVEVGGRQLTVRPLTLDQIIDSVDALAEIAGKIGDSEISWMKVIKENREFAYKLIGECAGIPIDKFGSLTGTEAFAVIQAFIAENQSFFTEQLLPLIRQVTQAARAAVGETSSPNSENMDITGQTAES